MYVKGSVYNQKLSGKHSFMSGQVFFQSPANNSITKTDTIRLFNNSFGNLSDTLHHFIIRPTSDTSPGKTCVSIPTRIHPITYKLLEPG